MKTTTILILLIVLSGMLSMAHNITFIKAEDPIFINADGSVNPPTAAIKRNGNLYSFTADVSEPITVQRSDAVIDGKGYALRGDGTGYGFDLPNTKNITITNLKISKFSTGIRLYNSTEATLDNNTVTECVYGILPSRSPNSTIINNVVEGNYWDGIFLTYSDASIIINNTIADHSKWGLYLGSSAGIVLRNNKIINNRWNFAVSENFIHDIDASNSVDEKPIYYLVNQHDKQVPANAGYVAVINSTDITAKNLDLTKNGQGVVLVDSKNCYVENSSITKMGYYAIQLVDADDNTIRNNYIADNRPPYFGVGIAIQSLSSGNIIRNNIIQNNEEGILIYNSGNNKIYHNNFLGNTVQASSKDSTNIWDNGYPSGGNYWNDYNVTDEKKGSNQSEPGEDGIGDKPYVIDANNRDNYPFMSMVQKETDSGFIQWELIGVSVGIATIILAAALICFIRNRMRKQKKLETNARMPSEG